MSSRISISWTSMTRLSLWCFLRLMEVCYNIKWICQKKNHDLADLTQQQMHCGRWKFLVRFAVVPIWKFTFLWFMVLVLLFCYSWLIMQGIIWDKRNLCYCLAIMPIIKKRKLSKKLILSLPNLDMGWIYHVFNSVNAISRCGINILWFKIQLLD